MPKSVAQRVPNRLFDVLLERERIISGLRDVIAALDRRLPHVNLSAIQGNADEAAAVRREAIDRLEHLGEEGGWTRGPTARAV